MDRTQFVFFLTTLLDGHHLLKIFQICGTPDEELMKKIEGDAVCYVILSRQLQYKMLIK